MPQLLSCPNELLLELVGILSHGGLESFALTCKRAFILSADTIAEKKRRYSTITCGQVPEYGDHPGIHPFLTLREILLDESIAIYPTKMLIGYCTPWQSVVTWGSIINWDSEDDDYRDSIETIGPISQQAFKLEDLIVSAVARCSSILDDSDDFHKKRILDGRSDTAIGMLIKMLPNLGLIECSSNLSNCPTLARILSRTSKTLATHIGDNSENSSQLKVRSVECAMKAETNGTASEGMKDFQATGELRHVKAVGREISMRSVAPLMEIESVRTLSGINYDGSLFGDCDQFPAELNVSAITRIEFENSAIYSGDIEGLLKNVKTLQHFKYSYSATVMTNGLWTLWYDIRTLSRYHSHSLLSLDLTGGRVVEAKLLESCLIRRYLKEFQVLHTIRLDNTVLTAQERFRVDPISTADLFPATMESLTLARRFGKGVAQELLRDFPSCKKGNFPRLSKIVFEENPGLEEELKQALRHAGIMLQLPDDEGTSEEHVAKPERE